jgi:acyl-CoA synthetase (AMP-forming)/AMP-acid ligase II
MIAGQATRQAVAAAGDRIPLVRPDGHEATGQEVEARTTGLALALGKQGLGRRRIGLWSWNSAAAIEAHLATEWIGATRVPVDPGAPPAEAAAVFKAAGWLSSSLTPPTSPMLRPARWCTTTTARYRPPEPRFLGRHQPDLDQVQRADEPVADAEAAALPGKTLKMISATR